jgi:hypothetical protein
LAAGSGNVSAPSALALHPIAEGSTYGGQTMASNLKRADHVEWNSEAGRVRGTIQKKVTAEIVFKGYKRHASKEQPQYIIKSDKTDHLAIHKATALKKIAKRKG